MPQIPGIGELSERLEGCRGEHSAYSTLGLFRSRNQYCGRAQCRDEGDQAWEVRVAHEKVCDSQNREKAEPAEREPSAGMNTTAARGKQRGESSNSKLPCSSRQFIERKGAAIWGGHHSDAQ